MWTPTPEYRRRALRLGFEGRDVAVLQLNLKRIGTTLGGEYEALTGVGIDGGFGAETGTLVRLYQRVRPGLDDDGVAGYMTDRYMAIDLMRPWQTKYAVAVGLMKGLVEEECAFDPAAVAHGFVGVEDGFEEYFDCGWTMDHIRAGSFSEDRFKRAFDGERAFEALARRLRENRDNFQGALGPWWCPPGPRRPWYCAIGQWNWPAAAEKYAAGRTNWTYYERLPSGDVVARRMDEPAYWITKFNIPGVSTGHEWFQRYVESKTGYVAHNGWTT